MDQNGFGALDEFGVHKPAYQVFVPTRCAVQAVFGGFFMELWLAVDVWMEDADWLLGL